MSDETTTLGSYRVIDGEGITTLVPAGLTPLAARLKQVVAQRNRDVALMGASDRWRPGQPDVSVYEPGDVPAMRCSQNGHVFELAVQMVKLIEAGRLRGAAQERAEHFIREKALFPVLVYEAAPFFVPAPVAIAAAESDSPPLELVEDLRLPFPSIWVIFGRDLELPEGMDWPSNTAWEIPREDQVLAVTPVGSWKRNIAGALHERGGALNGVVLFAGPDGVGLADEVIWTLSANPDPEMAFPENLDRQRGMVPGRRSLSTLAPIIDNLALFVASSRWQDTPKELPGIGEPGSERWLRSLNRAKARRSLLRGAGSGVRVVNLPVQAPALSHRGNGATPGRPMPPHPRRGHWRRSRVATRDEHGEVVGGVHGEHGVDWHYVGHWIPPVFIHPERAGESSLHVWRLSMPTGQSDAEE